MFAKISKLAHYNRKFWSRPRFYVMKVLGRSRLVRAVMPLVSNRGLVTPNLQATSLFPDLDVKRVVTDLKRDGCAFQINLPLPVVDELVEFANRTACYANADTKQGFLCSQKQDAEAKVGKRIAVGSYFNTALECNAVARLERDPKLWEIAAGYLGTRPRHIGNQLWWSFAGDANYARNNPNDYGQRFHYDLDDYGFVKFFFYLTDVDDGSGPHVCVRGTHRKKHWLHQLQYKRYLDNEIVDKYGADNVVTIKGPRGTGFVEDTYCFHKGTVPNQGNRLLLQVQFAINDYRVQYDVVDKKELVSLFP